MTGKCQQFNEPLLPDTRPVCTQPSGFLSVPTPKANQAHRQNTRNPGPK